MIKNSCIELLKQRADIVEVISHFVEVRKQGVSYVCVCPFHDDRNPSMHINPQKGFYHCFACRAGGDVFKFVMDFEKLSFAQAVEKVAHLSNFSLSYTTDKNENKRDLKHILPLLHAFYKQNLSQNKKALAYLYERRLSDEDLRKFELGFAPSSEESLRLLKNEGISLEDALAAGAVKRDERGEFYASLIQRISFPIYDYRGVLVGFGGRSLDANRAKYINSPQSALFDKSRIFYALHLAKESIIKKREIIICEGYMDAIALHKAGFDNAVAVLGVALSELHTPIIKRLEARVVLCFDSDEAGLRAAMRSALLLSTHQIDGRVALIKGGKDPADLMANGEGARLRGILEGGMELGEFYIRMLLKEPSSTPLEKQKALERVQKYTFELEPLVANSYVGLVAGLLGVGEDLVALSKKSRRKVGVNFRPGPQISLGELELLSYMKRRASARELFGCVSDKACLRHQILLEKILAEKGLDDEDIRELELKNLNHIKNDGDFLLALCKINLAFFNAIPITHAHLALKKQLLSLIDKNGERLKKNLSEVENFKFLKENLSRIKSEKDPVLLEDLLRTWHKIFSQKHFSAFDLGDEPF